MSKQVPDFINPFRAAEGGQSIAGRLAFTRMQRLAEVVKNTEGSAEVALDFAVDEQGIPHVHGQVRCEVVLICQRCLEAMTVPIDVEMDLGIVGSDDEANRLPERYDPLVAGAEPVLVAELVEDEILLALPAVPRHEGKVCAAAIPEQVGEGDTAEVAANPFAILAQLKAKH